VREHAPKKNAANKFLSDSGRLIKEYKRVQIGRFFFASFAKIFALFAVKKGFTAKYAEEFAKFAKGIFIPFTV
jgi:hypothetical protein